MYRLRPVMSQIAKRVGFGRPDLADAAAEVIEEHPATTAVSKPVLMLDEDRAKVERAEATTSLAEQWAIIDGRQVVHDATVRYVFKDVLATPFGFFTKHQGFARFGPVRYADMISAPIERRQSGFFASNPITQQYFGHWIRDGLITTYLKRSHEELYFPSNPAWTHASRYVDLLKISRLAAPYVIFEVLSYCRDIGQNAGRAARLEQLQARVQGLFGDAGIPGAFIRRGKTGSPRVLLNEDEVAAALGARGFAIVSSTDPLEHIRCPYHGFDGGKPVEPPPSCITPGCAACDDQPGRSVQQSLYAHFIDHMPGQLATTVAVREGQGNRVDVSNLLRLIDLPAK